MSDEMSSEQIELELEQLDEKSEQCFQDCKLRTAMRIAREATRKAKTHQLAVHYLRGLFDQMRFGHGLLDPSATREASVELVMMLEDEENARRIQPDLDEGHYHWVRSWMSSCAYDNLAEATGMIEGFNSTGMHECINDGIQICRQTGKMECIKCFREYASDVYLASDDLAMVRHQCQSLLEYREETDDKDRRWSAHDKLGWMALLEGRLDKAIDEFQLALKLSQEENVYLKLRARLIVSVSLDEALILAGRERLDWDAIKQEVAIPEQGEWPVFEMMWKRLQALADVVGGNYEEGISKLTDLDRLLTEQKCTKEWFEIRLRLVAAYLLDGNRSRAESLVKGLEAKAHESQDFFTLSRITHLMSNEEVISPLPTLSGLQSGPIASASASTSEDETDAQSEHLEQSGSDEDEAQTPLAETITSYMQGIATCESDEDTVVLLDRIISHDAASIEDPQDAAYLIHISRFLVRGPESARKVWDWATSIRERFSDHAVTLSVVADLGHYFFEADAEEFKDIELDQLEKWIQLSLSLNANHPRNHARAGEFYMGTERPGEAERCFARAFRLDRSNGSVAMSLAELYRQTERPRDAMAALDLCLREGCDDPGVAWDAGMTALQLEQYDSLLTYMNKYLELGDVQPWAHYYRAISLIELKQYDESLLALEEEEKLDPPDRFHIRGYQCVATLEKGQTEAGNQLLKEVLDYPLQDLDTLSMHGLVRIFGRLWEAVASRPDDDEVRQSLARRMIQTGLAHDSYFQHLREQQDVDEEIHFYLITIKQPLSENWSESLSCLHGQQDWEEYIIEWGVLARNRDQALTMMQQFQDLCGPPEHSVLDIDESEETYEDRPGVVWQGHRWNESEMEDDEQPDFED